MAGDFLVWWEHFEKRLDARFANLDERFGHVQKALELQAEEYARRLEALNHAHQRALEVQATFVSAEKYEAQMKAAEVARKLALDRLDEKLASLDKSINQKLDDYITKAEARQAEMDQALALQEGAAAEAQRAAEAQGRKSDEQARELARKTNRNMAFAGLILSALIFLANWLG